MGQKITLRLCPEDSGLTVEGIAKDRSIIMTERYPKKLNEATKDQDSRDFRSTMLIRDHLYNSVICQ